MDNWENKAEASLTIFCVLVLVIFALSVCSYAVASERTLTLSYTHATERASKAPLELSEIKEVRVYNEMDGNLTLLAVVDVENNFYILDSSIHFACVRLSTVDIKGQEGRLTVLDKSKHCFDLAGAPTQVEIIWRWNVTSD